ncbi:aldo/keto reductase [Pseudarthrobacter sp. C4D7]|uniref:aldo/keto reductase n=1 Tax=Pseudarthrobacter sp. C4D7 TaxID=2735268 RepID=UPI0015850E6D|nr:aldo/keto reductase [Pseudarthrobacter sp. C4D7]NUT71422.1 hypothetical protein [Pseudarthrobacter sp. C4D7]
MPPAQVATAWVRERARRLATPGVPIIGPRRVAQLDDYLAALTLGLTEDQYDRLDDVSRIAPGIPHQANAKALNGLQGGQAAAFDASVVPVA